MTSLFSAWRKKTPALPLATPKRPAPAAAVPWTPDALEGLARRHPRRDTRATHEVCDAFARDAYHTLHLVAALVVQRNGLHSVALHMPHAAALADALAPYALSCDVTINA